MKAIKPLDKMVSDNTSFLENKFNLKVSVMNKKLPSI